MSIKFDNSQAAFEKIYDDLNKNGIPFGGTKCFFNYGFEILNPLDRDINVDFRGWKKEYAEYEWKWYLSEDPSAVEISKKAQIWKRCMDEDGRVNSNYGYQWSRGDQIKYVIDELTKNPVSRRASISIYDAKDRHNFENDTPCTYAIHFYLLKDMLNMSVMMRSNDLWYGFCNDQYCFSRLQEVISSAIGRPVGSYYHFVNNIHIYERHFDKNI